jgi:hypothetical protein
MKPFFQYTHFINTPVDVGSCIDEGCKQRTDASVPSEVLEREWVNEILIALARAMASDVLEDRSGQDLWVKLLNGLNANQKSVLLHESNYERVLAVLLRMDEQVLSSFASPSKVYTIKRIKEEFQNHAIQWKWVETWLSEGRGELKQIKAWLGYADLPSQKTGISTFHMREKSSNVIREVPARGLGTSISQTALELMDRLQLTREEVFSFCKLYPLDGLGITPWENETYAYWFKTRQPEVFQQAFQKKIKYWISQPGDDALTGQSMRALVSVCTKENWQSLAPHFDRMTERKSVNISKVNQISQKLLQLSIDAEYTKKKKTL